jgi:hypothetical protein
MSEKYEAVVQTVDGVFRATTPDPLCIAITEDGVDGIVDFIHLHPNETAAATAANLPITLKWWVLENVRGIEVMSTYLHLRS